MAAPNLGIDHEDLAFTILPQLERSFGIKFQPGDFSSEVTYGQLCKLIQARLLAKNANDCTSQQAFYKLRHALRQQLGEVVVQPATRLADLLPARRREAAIKLTTGLGMKLDLLKMPDKAAFSGTLLLLVSLLCLFFNQSLGLTGIGLAVAGMYAASRFSNVLRYETVREVVAAMSSQYYRQSRRSATTVNSQEVRAQLTCFMAEWAGIEPAQLITEAVVYP